MSAANKGKDDTIYKHFHSDEHQGLRDIEVHLIDKVNEKDNLLAKEGQWAYRLRSVRPVRVLMKVISFSARIGENVRVMSLWLGLYINVSFL